HYHDTYKVFPPAIAESHPKPDRLQWVSWLARILPFMDQRPLADNMEAAFKAQGAHPDPFLDPPHQGLATVLTSYRCPADARQYQATDVIDPTSTPTAA